MTTYRIFWTSLTTGYTAFTDEKAASREEAVSTLKRIYPNRKFTGVEVLPTTKS